MEGAAAAHGGRGGGGGVNRRRGRVGGVGHAAADGEAGRGEEGGRGRVWVERSRAGSLRIQININKKYCLII